MGSAHMQPGTLTEVLLPACRWKLRSSFSVLVICLMIQDPEKVLTSEDLGNEERRLFQKPGLPGFA